jgi:hypothetical protein
MGRPSPAGPIALLLVLGLGGGAAIAQPNGQALPAVPPAIYVADFELDADPPDDSAGRARELLDLMASSLVRNFTMVGLDARRLAPDEPLPAAGWLVRGVFVSVDAGNRFSRLAIGPASGGLKLQVVAVVDDLRHGPPKPIYERGRGADAGIAFNPYAIAVRFEPSSRGIARGTTASAAEISREIIQRARQ